MKIKGKKMERMVEVVSYQQCQQSAGGIDTYKKVVGRIPIRESQRIERIDLLFNCHELKCDWNVDWRRRGRPQRTWVDDPRDRTGSKRYHQVKRATEKRDLHGTFATHSSGHKNK